MPVMTCAEAEEARLDAASGALDPARAAAWERHVDACAACAAFSLSIDRLEGALTEALVAESAGVGASAGADAGGSRSRREAGRRPASALASGRAEGSGRAKRGGRRRALAVVGGGAALAAAAGLAVAVALGGLPSPDAPSSSPAFARRGEPVGAGSGTRAALVVEPSSALAERGVELALAHDEPARLAGPAAERLRLALADAFAD